MFFHGFLIHPPTQLSERDNIQRRFTNNTQVNDDEKILKLNIDLAISKHFNIISVNENLKN
jgi:hypothetical protein